MPALLFARAAPQSAWVRHFMALCQIGWSMLYMWLLEGHPEAQFHVFLSLVFLAFYRDWRVLVTATFAALAYPVLRIAMLPDSYVIGPRPGGASSTRASGWSCESSILLLAVTQSLKTIQKFAEHAATLQLTNEAIGKHVEERTRELERSREQYRLIAETTRAIPFELEPRRRPLHLHRPAGGKVLGFPEARWKEPGFLDVLLPA